MDKHNTRWEFKQPYEVPWTQYYLQKRMKKTHTPLFETNKNKCPKIISLSWIYKHYDLLERSLGHLELGDPN